MNGCIKTDGTGIVLITTRDLVSDFMVIFEGYTWANAFKMKQLTGELQQRDSALRFFGGLDEGLSECKSVRKRGRDAVPREGVLLPVASATILDIASRIFL